MTKEGETDRGGGEVGEESRMHCANKLHMQNRLEIHKEVQVSISTDRRDSLPLIIPCRGRSAVVPSCCSFSGLCPPLSSPASPLKLMRREQRPRLMNRAYRSTGLG